MEQHNIQKTATGIQGLDGIALGGLPSGRTTLVAGTAGTGKTVFAAQFLAEGVRQFHEPGVFVTFEESAADIRRNVASLGWNVAAWESADQWAFIDASPQPGEEVLITGSFDLGALLVRIETTVKRLGAKRVSIDSLARFSPASTAI